MQPLRDGEGHARADDRQEPQHGAAVGQQQDHDDDPEGGEQQGAVDALEHLGRVRGLATRAADVDVHPVDGSAMSRSSSATSGISIHPLAPKLNVTSVCITRRPRRAAGRCTSPSTPSRFANSATSAWAAAMSAWDRPAVTFVDDHGRDGVGVLERRELVEGSRGLGGGGQPGRGLVVLDVGELRREAARHPDGQDPEDQHDPLGHAPRQLAGDLSMHAQFDHSSTADSSGFSSWIRQRPSARYGCVVPGA